MPETKSELREYFRAKRHALSKAEREAHARQLLDIFIHEEALHNLSPVAGYVATYHEADPGYIIEYTFNKNKKTLLPKTTEDKKLIFCDWRPGDILHEAKFHIPEPENTFPAIPHLILIPLLAFDTEGHRLGYGGGYYDRTLSKPAYKDAIRIGIAYAFQRTKHLPRDAHDVRLHGVMTEEGMQWF
ncbi:MAG: 5-formyltetrahydrofolate cyclo-ligase [Rickettsiales bacterium]